MLCINININVIILLILNITLTALAPEITEPPHNVETVDGRAVTIGCKNFGVPKPHVKWTKNNIELTGGRYSTLDNGDLQIRLVVQNVFNLKYL